MLNEEERLSDLTTNISFPVASYSIDTLLKNIIDGTFSVEKVKSLIRFDIDDFLNYDSFERPESRRQMQDLWTNKFFLNCFLKCLTEDNGFVDIMNGYKHEINKIIFDYVFVSEDTSIIKDSEINDLFIQIAKAVNIKEIIPLLTIMNPELAWQIVVCRYSDLNESECIRKLNEAIISSGMDFSIEDIIYIYSRFYPENFRTLFKVTMCQIFDTSNFDDLQLKLNDRISWSMLYILNTLTSADILTVIMEYKCYLEAFGQIDMQHNTRFDIQNIPDDFSRIRKIVNEAWW